MNASFCGRLIQDRLLRSPSLASSLCPKMALSSSSFAVQKHLLPPESVRGMKELDISQFNKRLRIPYIRVKESRISRILMQVKPYMLKAQNMKPIRDEEPSAEKLLLLNPDLVRSPLDFKPDVLDLLRGQEVRFAVDGEQKGPMDFGYEDVEFTYDNWKCDQILDAVLPDDKEKMKGYSVVGHIVHLNLREHLTEFRYLIGKVLLDKLKGVTCVVNKTENIDNTYRNFTMEVIAGDGNMLTEVKENGCSYKFDFDKVFWNPRLCTEHERLVEMFQEGCAVYDVFAGVGPFAIPAARKMKAVVFANDLNPHSFKWLVENIALNKVQERVKAYNLDGRQFIREVVKKGLIERADAHVVMNLPAASHEFLGEFQGLLSGEQRPEEWKCPLVHCYVFAKKEDFREDALQKVQSGLQGLLDLNECKVFNVRNVAPNKEMVRVTFRLTRSILFGKTPLEEPYVPEPKRLCVDSK